MKQNDELQREHDVKGKPFGLDSSPSDATSSVPHPEFDIPTQSNINAIRNLRKKKREHNLYDEWEKKMEQTHNKVEPSENSFNKDDHIYPIESFSVDEDVKHGRFSADGYFVFKREKKKRFYRERQPTDDEDENENEDDEDEVFSDPWLDSIENASFSEHRNSDWNVPSQPATHTPTAGCLAEKMLQEKSNEFIFCSLAECLDANNETPARALKRLAQPSNTSSNQHGGQNLRHTSQRRPQRTALNHESQQTFNSITEHCNVLMLNRGYHDIFSMTRDDILQEARRAPRRSSAPQPPVTQHLGSTETGEDEPYYTIRFRHCEKQEKPRGPHTLGEVHKFIDTQYISENNPADIMEVSSTGIPLNGVWHGWDSFGVAKSKPDPLLQRINEKNSSSGDSSSDNSDRDFDLEDYPT